MTLLRRAPREVYRVYAEDEFFAGTGIDESWEPNASAADRRMQRIAGATMLVAAVGAVGGLIAFTGLSSATRAGRRARGSLLATAGSLGSSRAMGAHVWRLPTGADGSFHQGAAIRRTASAHARREVTPQRAAAVRRAQIAAARDRGVPVEAVMSASPTRIAAGASPGSSASPEPGTSPEPSASPEPSTSAGPPGSGTPEFGFER